MTTVAADGLLLRDLLQWFGFRVIWTVETDSSAAKGMAMRQGVGKVRHLDVRSLWTQRAVRELGLIIKKINGSTNPADIGTKAHTAAEHERFCNLAGLARKADWESVPVVDVNAIERSITCDALSITCNALLAQLGRLELPRRSEPQAS